MKPEINRRSFIKGSAAVGGLAVLTSFVGCSGETSSTGQNVTENTDGLPEKWDFEADIIAIGAGGAGLGAGIEAGTQEVSIIILESQEVVGGNSAICNGGMSIPGTPLQKEQGIEDSPDIMFDDLCSWYKTDYNADYWRLLCDLQGGDAYDWYLAQGIEFQASGLLQSAGHSRPREHHVDPGKTISILQKRAEESGADIRLRTKATRLIQHPVTKRIVGVKAESNGTEQYFKAKKGVLLCSGGFGRNTDLLCDWMFGPSVYDMTAFNGSLGQDASGMLMAMDIGAATRHVGYGHMLTVQNPDGGHGDACAMYHQGAVLINIEGERFVNEAQGYTNVWTELLQQPESVCWQVWDEPIATACAENESGYYSMKKIEETGLMIKANTYEELAALTGMPEQTLVATLNRYNEDIGASGKDTVMGREHLVATGGTLTALNTAPFYAFKTTNIISSTQGGLKRYDGDQLRASDNFGNAIEGLYLAGNVSDYCNGGMIPGTRRSATASGVSFGPSITFGRYCAQKIAELDNWDEA